MCNSLWLSTNCAWTFPIFASFDALCRIQECEKNHVSVTHKGRYDWRGYCMRASRCKFCCQFVHFSGHMGKEQSAETQTNAYKCTPLPQTHATPPLIFRPLACIPSYRKLKINHWFCIARRAPDYSSNLRPPKIWSIWLFQGVFWAFYARKRRKQAQDTP